LAILVALYLWLTAEQGARPDWSQVIYHLAVVLGIGGLSAYLGRQAGQHRRVFNWAKAVSVQLRSFPAFIQPVASTEVLAQIYLAFSNRVLGAMPERAGKSGNPDAVGMAQVVELVAAMTKMPNA
jgi:hypothetical protein